MKKNNAYRKFQAYQDKILDLEKTNARFKRVFTEYTLMSQELWTLQNTKEVELPDDFVNSVILQKSLLEEEIEDWLKIPSHKAPKNLL